MPVRKVAPATRIRHLNEELERAYVRYHCLKEVSDKRDADLKKLDADLKKVQGAYDAVNVINRVLHKDVQRLTGRVHHLNRVIRTLGGAFTGSI